MYIVNSIENSSNKKYCFKLEDESIIESALFEHNEAIHFCIPTQVGCNMGCRHCATTYAKNPYVRNLSFDEINTLITLTKGQLWNEMCPRILSFSGHGEPMMNWDNIKKCINKYHGDFNSIYLTSIGVVDTFDKILMDSFFLPDIYFSIHGSDDIEREQLIPSVKNKNIADLKQIISFGRQYFKSGGRIVWNYMLCNVNSSEKSFQKLCILCEKVDYPIEIRFTKYIDIHKYNNIKEVTNSVMDKFCDKLLKKSYAHVNIRRSKLEGETMGIACGQMRASRQ